ncbi:hypothetical protein [Salinispora pacifica]|uniref:hypothetical protein n=1 Tax=Salinispora pacifica TaxID=351187 RepID=UPI00036DA481|nr:hypothetical protein [Salinispora pacifica]
MALWLYRIDLSDFFHKPWSFERKRDLIVDRLRGSEWVKAHGEDSLLVVAINEMAHATEVEDFDDWWDEVYDLADRDLVWINT